MMSDLPQRLTNIDGRRAGLWHRAASIVGTRSLMLASLVLAATTILPHALHAAPAGAAGTSSAVSRVGLSAAFHRTTLSPMLRASAGTDPPITFSFNIGGYIGSGNLVATDLGGGLFQAYGGTLTMAGNSAGDAGNTYCLVAVTPDWTTGALSTSPLGLFIYDDLLTPTATLAFPTIGGLVFSNAQNGCTPNPSDNGVTHEINIWAGINGAYTNIPGQYSFYDGGAGQGYVIAYSTQAPYGDSFSAAVATYNIGVSLTGLTSGSVKLQDVSNNVVDNLTVSTNNNTVNFATQIASGQPYAVTVTSAPPGVYCAPGAGASGTVGSADVVVQFTCAPTKSYVYSGNGFKTFSCGNNPDCGTSGPNANTSYATNNSITASLTLASALPSSQTTQVNCSAPGFQLVLSDGRQTLTQAGCPDGGSYSACVTTDNSGNPIGWLLALQPGGPGDRVSTSNDPNNLCGANSGVLDRGQLTSTNYAYTTSPGSFSPGYTGGVTPASSCVGNSCNIVPGNTFTILGPNAGAIPPGAVLTEQECVVLQDPRGKNCGAFNGQPPRSLNVSSVCSGFGNEVIPDYMCGASGPNGTGFALILGNAEQVDTLNGTYGDSELDVEKVPQLAGSPTNPTCPKAPLGGRPSALAAVGTRSGSLVEEQTPEMTLSGQPLLLEMTSSCDPPKSNHGPGLTLEGVGFKLRTNDTTVKNKLTDAQNMLLFANYKYVNLDVVMLLTKFTNSPVPNVRQTLQNCINKSQTLLNTGPSKYICAAEQVYRCEQIVDNLGPNFQQFGPSTSPLRLPDPYGDIVRRLGNLYYTINTRINGQAPNVLSPNTDWPLPASPGHPLGDPYPGQCP